MDRLKSLIAHKAFRFVLTLILLYLIWFLTYEFWLKPQGALDIWLTQTTTSASVVVLDLLGYSASQVNLGQQCLIYSGENLMIGIAHNCNAQVLYALFTLFVISYPGSVKHKFWFIPAGIIGIFVINTIRVVSLSLINVYFPAALEFNHKYTFTVFVYGCIFMLWMIWIKKFSIFGNRKSQA